MKYICHTTWQQNSSALEKCFLRSCNRTLSLLDDLPLEGGKKNWVKCGCSSTQLKFFISWRALTTEFVKYRKLSPWKSNSLASLITLTRATKNKLCYFLLSSFVKLLSTGDLVLPDVSPCSLNEFLSTVRTYRVTLMGWQFFSPCFVFGRGGTAKWVTDGAPKLHPISTVQGYSYDQLIGWVDLDLGSSPGWWPIL